MSLNGTVSREVRGPKHELYTEVYALESNPTTHTITYDLYLYGQDGLHLGAVVRYVDRLTGAVEEHVTGQVPVWVQLVSLSELEALLQQVAASKLSFIEPLPVEPLPA